MRSSTHYKHPGTILGATAIFAATTLALSACGSAGASQESSEPIEEGPATGTIEIWVQGAEGATLPEMFDDFQEDNPDAEFTFTEVPEEEFLTKMTAAIAAGSVPDLIYGYSQTDASLLATEGFDPVPEGLVSEDDFFESIWDLSVVNDVAYGVPWYANSNGTYFRSDLLEAAGLEIPETWDELTTYGETVKAQGVQFPIALSIDWGVNTGGLLEVLNKQNGGGFLSEDGTEWTINDPANVEALEFYGGLMQAGLASPDGPTFLDLIPSFTDGRTTAVYDIGTFIKGFIAQANGPEYFDEHVTFAANAYPEDGVPGAGVSGGTWFVPADAENKDGAWKFVQFMSEPETQLEWYSLFGSLPASVDAWDDPALSDDAFLQVVREGIENGVAPPNVATWPEVASFIGAAAEQVSRGLATAQDALNEAQERAAAVGTE